MATDSKMRQNNINNVRYAISDKASRLEIIAQVSLPNFNKLALRVIGGIVIPIIIVFFWWLTISSVAPIGMYIFSVFSSCLLLVIAYLSFKAVKGSTLWELVVDKSTKTLSSKRDHFSVDLDDIVDIRVSENVSIFGVIPFLKLTLKNGEKTLMFPLDSYNRGTDFIKLINQASGRK